MSRTSRRRDARHEYAWVLRDYDPVVRDWRRIDARSRAGRIADGSATIEEMGWELFRLMLEVASGRKKTWAEHWKLHNALVLFNPAPVT